MNATIKRHDDPPDVEIPVRTVIGPGTYVNLATAAIVIAALFAGREWLNAKFDRLEHRLDDRERQCVTISSAVAIQQRVCEVLPEPERSLIQRVNIRDVIAEQREHL